LPTTDVGEGDHAYSKDDDKFWKRTGSSWVEVGTGAGGVSDGDKGDITVTGSGATWTIDGDVVSFAKLQNIATDRLLGRDAAATGDVEEITVGGGLEFSGSTGIQRSALTGDVTAAAGSAATDIDEAAVEAELEGVIDLPDLQGILTAAKGGTGDDTSGQTGVAQVTAGNWTYDGGVGDLADDLGCTGSQVVRRNAGDTAWECFTASASGAPSDAEYIVAEAHGGLSAEVAPGTDDQVPSSDSSTSASWKTLPNGAVSYSTAGNAFSQAGVSNLAASTSADLRGVLSDEVGGGAAMFGLDPAMADGLTCSGSQVVRRNAGDTAFECATISAGSGNFLEVSIVLGDAGFYSTTVTGQSWVTGTSKIVCSTFGTTADGGTPELAAVAELEATVANRSAGVGFDLMIYNPHGASGTYRFHCSGV
jgi:hypothetical protein